MIFSVVVENLLRKFSTTTTDISKEPFLIFYTNLGFSGKITGCQLPLEPFQTRLSSNWVPLRSPVGKKNYQLRTWLTLPARSPR